MRNVSLSFFNPDRSFINGGSGISSAVDKVTKFLNIAPLTQALKVFHVCYVKDGMAVLKKLNPKRTWVKQSADLVAASNLAIGSHRSSRPEAVFCKKSVLKNFAKFTGKNLYQSLLLKKELYQKLY